MKLSKESAHSPRVFIEAIERRALLAATIVNDPNHVQFNRVVIDPNVVVNGHKAKALMDVDGDGFTDVIDITVGDGLYWYKYPTWTKFKIWNGNNESFEDGQAADIDNDGDMDFVMADRWLENPVAQGGNPNSLWTERLMGSTNERHDAEVGDINLDGKLDVAFIDGMFIQNTPTSWTTLPKSTFPGRGGHGSALGDVDSDGDLDLLAPTASAPYKLVWYENPTIGGTTPITSPWTQRVLAPGFDRLSCLVVDMDEDGKNDVVLGPDEGNSAPIVWLKAPANPKAAVATWVSTIIEPVAEAIHTGSIEPADYNQDGHLDLFVVEQEQSPLDRLMIFYGNGTGQKFVRQIFAPPGGGHNPKIGDIDNDGDVDILNVNHGFYGEPNPITLWINQTNPVNLPIVTVTVPDRTASETNRDPGMFRFTRTGKTDDLLIVQYAIKGSATSPADYDALAGSVLIPAGQTSADVVVLPVDDSNVEGLEAVTATVLADPTYCITIGATVPQTPAIVIADNDTSPLTDKYLSDLTPTFTSNGWGPYERDRSNGETASNDGKTITLNGVAYGRGLGVHAASELRYALGGQYKRFLASIGVDDEVGSNGSVVFQVWADGSMLFQSVTMTGNSATQTLNMNVTNKNELRLIVTNAGNGNGSDHADWANARVTAGPVVLGSTLDFLTGPPVVKFAFSTDIAQLPTVSQIQVLNLTTAQPISAGAMALVWDADTRTAILSFPGLPGGRLQDGDYRVTILAGNVADAGGNTLAADYISNFFYLNGDLDHNRAVEFADILQLASNWGRTGANYLKGDVNYDGRVDSNDLSILGLNWLKRL